MQGPYCQIYSLAMVLNRPAKEIYSQLLDVNNRTIFDFHAQDLIRVALNHGVALIPLSRILTIETDSSLDNQDRSDEYREELAKGPALLYSDTHAVAWDGTQIYDPNGRIEKLDINKYPDCFLARTIKV